MKTEMILDCGCEAVVLQTETGITRGAMRYSSKTCKRGELNHLSDISVLTGMVVVLKGNSSLYFQLKDND